MMYLKMLCASLSAMALVSVESTLTSCDASGQTDCTSSERCSTINVDPLQNVCFPQFTASEYDSITVAVTPSAGGSSSRIVGEADDTASFTDLANVVDGNWSTSVSFPSDRSYRFVTISFPSTYWVHDFVVVTPRVPLIPWAVMNGQRVDLDDDQVSDSSVFQYKLLVDPESPPLLPTFISNFTFVWYADKSVDILSIDIFGLQSTPTPTTAPTDAPTSSTTNPTAAPTNAPSASPTPAPTSYPTADVCQELIVRQNCCGDRGFFIQSDKTNLRNASLTTCEYTFREQCCGTLGGYVFTSSRYGCGGQTADETVCAIYMFDPDVNPTDDIKGVIIAAESIAPEGFDDFAAYYASVPGANKGGTEQACVCDWTVNECAGEDAAVCGSSAQFDEFMSAACWVNDTLAWNESNVDIAEVATEPCFQELIADQADEFAHLAWSPCSAEAFRGSVLEVQVSEGETILNDECYCEYAIRQCDVTEDPPRKQCADVKADGSANCDAGECEIEVANPCCVTAFDARYEAYNGVTAITDERGVPVEDTWKCLDEMGELTGAALCGDLWNGERTFTPEVTVSWWYDMGELYSRCGCLYTVDECNLPTSSPTLEPTVLPTVEPTSMPTAAPTNAEGTGDDAFALKLTRMVYLLSVVGVFSFFC